MQVAALEAAGMIEIKEGKKCWKGYKKAGTQKLFGKTYNRCVKAGDELNHDGQQLQEVELPNFGKGSGRKPPIPSEQQKKASEKLELPNFGNKKKKPEEKSKPQNKQMSGDASQQTIDVKADRIESFARVTEGVMALMKKKEEKKNLNPLSQHL